jgi:NAD(P)-dependent dehydrogenase (short-subunit alcohol dehydrogenase family)
MRDVHDSAAVQALVDEGVREFGRLDVVGANAGIGVIVANTWTTTEEVSLLVDAGFLQR